MNSISREQQRQILIDTAQCIINRKNISTYSENMRELARIALGSLTSEAVVYQYRNFNSDFNDWDDWEDCDENTFGKYRMDEKCHTGTQTRILYTSPPEPVTSVDNDVRKIIDLLESGEWTENSASTVLGARLESEITRHVGSMMKQNGGKNQ